MGRLARRRLFKAEPIGILVLKALVPSQQGAWRSPHGTDWARFDLESADVDPRAAVLEDGVVLRGVLVCGDQVEADVESVVIAVDAVRFYLLATARLYLLAMAPLERISTLLGICHTTTYYH